MDQRPHLVARRFHATVVELVRKIRRIVCKKLVGRKSYVPEDSILHTVRRNNTPGRVGSRFGCLGYWLQRKLPIGIRICLEGSLLRSYIEGVVPIGDSSVDFPRHWNIELLRYLEVAVRIVSAHVVLIENVGRSVLIDRDREIAAPLLGQKH